MNSNFQKSLAAVLKNEGGFVNHPQDPGGATNLGVTLAVAQKLGIDVDHDGDVDIVDIKLLKPADAAKVYKNQYWDKVRGDSLPAGLDYAVFDFGINSGVSRASIFLQDLVGAAPDGAIGNLTIQKIGTKNTKDLINQLMDKRLAFLKQLSTWPTFGKGWANRVAEVRQLALSMSN